MLTVSEIENKKFSKAIIGGYDTEDVNEFLSKVAEDYDRLLSDTETLKGKLKLLVEKLEEYRDIEDSLRKALFTAEKTADKVKEEARHRCESMFKDTQLAIEKEKREAQRQLKVETARLQEAKNQTAAFLKTCMGIYNKQIQLLNNIPNLNIEIDEETDQAMIVSPKDMAVKSAAKEISDSIAREEAPKPDKDRLKANKELVEEIVFDDIIAQPEKQQDEEADLAAAETVSKAELIEDKPIKADPEKSEASDPVVNAEPEAKIDLPNFEKRAAPDEEAKESRETKETEKGEDNAPVKRRGLEIKVIELNLNKPPQTRAKNESALSEDEEEEPSSQEKFDDLKFGKNYDIRKNRQ